VVGRKGERWMMGAGNGRWKMVVVVEVDATH
jgi:hypothetical protein